MSDYIKLSPSHKAFLDAVRVKSETVPGRHFVDAVLGMGTSMQSISLFNLRQGTEYNTAATIAVFQNGVRE